MERSWIREEWRLGWICGLSFGVVDGCDLAWKSGRCFGVLEREGLVGGEGSRRRDFGFCGRVSWSAGAAMRRPEIREVQSVGSVLKQAGQLWRTCLIPICILALVSAIYSFTLETYALSPSLAFAQLDGNYSLSQKVNSSLGQSRSSQDLKTSRANFEGGLKEGSDDKGFVARYLAMFLTSLDEAVMESLAESREKISAYESRAGDSRTASLKQDASQADYSTQAPEVRVLFRSCRHVFCINCVAHNFLVCACEYFTRPAWILVKSI